MKNFFVLMLLLFNINLAYTQTFIVTNTNASGSGSFEEAITAASNITTGAVTIQFESNVTGTITSSGGNITVPIEIIGPGNDMLTISQAMLNFTASAHIEGFKLSQGAIRSSAALALIKMTIEEGFTTQNGGAVNASLGDLTLENCKIINNSAKNGGGIYYEGIDGVSNLIISNSILENNISSDYGGGLFAKNCKATIVNSRFENNKASESDDSGGGGGIYFSGNNPVTIEKSIITSNSVGGNGGGIWCNGTLNLYETIVGNNEATSSGGGIVILEKNPNDKSKVNYSSIINNQSLGGGGGIFSLGDLELNNTTISGNITREISSALHHLFGAIEMVFCTITNNLTTETHNGNAISFYNISDEDPANLIITNCLVAGNKSYDKDNYTTDIVVSSNYNQVITYNLFNKVGSGLAQHPTNTITTNPREWGLVQLDNNGGFTPTHALFDYSVAINSADPSVDSGTDQRGFDRVQKSRADIGALESSFPLGKLLSLEPSVIYMPFNTTEELVVTLTEPAPIGGLTLNLSSSHPEIATVASMISVPEGKSSASIIVSSLNSSEVTTISVSHGGSTLTSDVAVVSEIPEDPTPCFATEVVNFNQAKKKNGGTISNQRSNPQQALDAPQENDTYNFVALGFGGSITLKLGQDLYDDGTYEPDLILVETSFGRADQMCYNSGERNYPEMAFLEVSEDNNTWYSLPNAYCRTSFVDISPAVEEGLAYVRYLRITDASNKSWLGGNADGYDVDGIITCREEVLAAFDRLTNARTLANGNTELGEFMAFDPAFFNKTPNEEVPFAVKMFPNPVRDQQLHLEYSSENSGNGVLRIVDIMGKTLLEKAISLQPGLNRMEVDVAALPIGHYVLQLQLSQGERVVEKVIKY